MGTKASFYGGGLYLVGSSDKQMRPHVRAYRFRTTATALTLRTPDATACRKGQPFFVLNDPTSLFNFNVKDRDGTQLFPVGITTGAMIFCVDNSTRAGLWAWRSFTGSSAIDA